MYYQKKSSNEGGSWSIVIKYLKLVSILHVSTLSPDKNTRTWSNWWFLLELCYIDPNTLIWSRDNAESVQVIQVICWEVYTYCNMGGTQPHWSIKIHLLSGIL